MCRSSPRFTCIPYVFLSEHMHNVNNLFLDVAPGRYMMAFSDFLSDVNKGQNDIYIILSYLLTFYGVYCF
jgi:hypothetical protein